MVLFVSQMATKNLIIFIILVGLISTMASAEKLKTGYKMPAFGNSDFVLGTLYDAYNDKIAGIERPWDQKTIEKYVTRKETPSTQTNSVIGNSLDDRKKAVGIELDLTLSLLWGLADIKLGTARFLESRSHSHYEAVATFYYHSRKYEKEFSVSSLPIIQYPHVLEQAKDATHVVAGIVYGNNGIFKFKRVVNTYTEENHVTGNLRSEAVKIKELISGIEVKGDKIIVPEDQKVNYTQVNFTYAGDVSVLEQPTTFIEAVKLFKEFPKRANESVPVPIKVFLVPIGHISDQFTRAVYSIRETVLSELKHRMEEYEKLYIKVGDIKIGKAYQRLPLFKQHVDDLEEAIKLHKTNLKTELSKVVPRVRKNEIDASEVTKVLQQENSWYPIQKLHDWVEEKLSETGGLSHFAGADPKLIVVGSGKFASTITSNDLTNVVVFNIRVLKKTDLFSKCVRLNCDYNVSNAQCKELKCKAEIKYVSWLKDDMFHQLQSKNGDFKELLENKDSKTKIIIHEETLGENEKPSLKIALYEQAKNLTSNLHLPEMKVKVESRDCVSTTVSWNVKVDQSSSKWFLNTVTVKYYSLFPNDTSGPLRPVRHDGRSNGKLTIKLGRNFEIMILAHCSFGVCATHSETFKEYPFNVDCKNNVLTWKLIGFEQSWTDALLYCTTVRKSNLPSIHNDEQAKHARGLSKLLPQSKQQVWIGGFVGSKQNWTKGYWVWSDKTKWGDYKNWINGEPNNQDRACLTARSGKGWNDEICDQKHWFICKN